MKLLQTSRRVRSWFSDASLLAFLLLLPLTAESVERKGDISVLPTHALRKSGIEVHADQVPVSNRTNWQVLVCGENACELRPIRLQFDLQESDSSMRISPAPDETGLPVAGEFAIAVIHGMPVRNKVSTPTWYGQRRPTHTGDEANGTLGRSFTVSNGETYRVLPRWRKGSQDRFMTLYLESKRSRQRLGIVSFENINPGLRPEVDILIWAGDLDGDGKPDLITRAGNSGLVRGLHLWLSSRAIGPEMVGLASSIEDWSEGEDAEERNDDEKSEEAEEK